MDLCQASKSCATNQIAAGWLLIAFFLETIFTRTISNLTGMNEIWRVNVVLLAERLLRKRPGGK